MACCQCTPARTAARRPPCAGHRGAPLLLVLVGSSGQPPVQIGRGRLPPQRVPEPAAAQVCAAASAPRARVRACPAAAPAAQPGPARIPAPPGPGRGPELALALPAAAAAGAGGRRRVERQVAEELVAHMALRARVAARPGAAPAQRQGGSRRGCSQDAQRRLRSATRPQQCCGRCMLGVRPGHTRPRRRQSTQCHGCCCDTCDMRKWPRRGAARVRGPAAHPSRRDSSRPTFQLAGALGALAAGALPPMSAALALTSPRCFTGSLSLPRRAMLSPQRAPSRLGQLTGSRCAHRQPRRRLSKLPRGDVRRSLTRLTSSR